MLRARRLVVAAGVAAAGYYGYKHYNSFNDQILANWARQYADVPAPSRKEHKARLQSEQFDVLVIGGGATGTGVALDAATRGMKVALVERDDFASGASSKSTKLLHGGVRYLEKAAKHLDYGEFKLVTEALHERTRVLHNAPHLSHPLPIVLPIKTWIDLPQFWIGLKMYDAIAGPSGMFHSYYLSHEKTLTVFPTINPDMFKCALVYYDGQMNDARLNVTLALTSAVHGAAVANHTEVLRLIKKPNPFKKLQDGASPPVLPQKEVPSRPATEHVALTPKGPEVPTDAGIGNTDSSSNTVSLVKDFIHASAHLPSDHPSSPPSSPSALTPHSSPRSPYSPTVNTSALPFNPAPPPPSAPFQKWVESLKTYVVGSHKNKETDVNPESLDDFIVAGAVVRDTLTGEIYEIHAKSVVNATGAFADSIRNMDTPVVRNLVAGSEGSHIILPNYLCPPNIGFIDAKSVDGRVIFLLPFENHTLVGTTDSPCEIVQNPKAPEADIQFILDQVRTYLHPDIKLKRSDVLAAWSGIRPLALDPRSHNTAEVSRNHVIHVDKSGLVSIVGGKWTTYRKMAEDTVDKVVDTIAIRPPHSSYTEKLPLWGAHKYRPTLNITLMQIYGMEQDIAIHLAHNYGDKAFLIAELARKGYGRRIVEELPFLEAEIVYSVNEYAETTVDVIARRTRLAFLDNEKTKTSVPKIVELLGAQLQWDDVRKAKEMRDAYAFLETMR